MLIYKKYLFKSSLYPLLIITFFLLVITLITQSVRHFDLIVTKGVSISNFITLIFYLLPSILFIILPISLLCTLLYIFSKLNRDKEIYTFKSMGLSNFSITKPFLYLALVITIVSYIISIYILPISYNKFKNLQFLLNNVTIAKLIQDNTFINNIKGLTFYIDSKVNPTTYNNIFIFDNRDKKKNIAIIAERCEIEGTSNGIKLILKNGTQQEYRNSKQSFSLMKFDTYAVNINLFQNNSSDRKSDPSEKNIKELFFDAKLRNRAHGHFRLIWPFLSLSITLIALNLLLNNKEIVYSCWKINLYVAIFNLVILISIILFYNLTHNNEIFAIPMYLVTILPCLYCLLIRNKT